MKKLINYLYKERILDQPATFDTPEFRAKIVGDTQMNDSVKKNVLEVIDNGFTVVKNSVDADLVDSAVRQFVDWKERNKAALKQFFKYDEMLDRIINIQDTLPIFDDLFSLNRALKVQDILFGKKTCLHSSLFFEVGSAQNIHRDIPLFWTNPANSYFGTWLALESTDTNNGPLQVIKGSHKLPLLERKEIASTVYEDPNEIKDIDDDLWNIYQSKIQETCLANGLKVEEVYVEKGDTIIWHPLLAHGGAQYKDKSRTRLSYVIHTTPDNVPVFHTDVFFNPEKKVVKYKQGDYRAYKGRNISVGKLSIGHKSDFDFDTLK
jgi:phytanoyl-CoA hydroxylase